MSDLLIVLGVFGQFLAGSFSLAWFAFRSAAKMSHSPRLGLRALGFTASVVFVLVLVILGEILTHEGAPLFFGAPYRLLFSGFAGEFGVFVILPIVMLLLSFLCLRGVIRRDRSWLRPEEWEK